MTEAALWRVKLAAPLGTIVPKSRIFFAAYPVHFGGSHSCGSHVDAAGKPTRCCCNLRRWDSALWMRRRTMLSENSLKGDAGLPGSSCFAVQVYAKKTPRDQITPRRRLRCDSDSTEL